MRTYEALYIVRPDVPDDEIQTVAKEVDSLITDHGGAIVRSEIWGKRRLAYTVKKCHEGVYVLVRFESSPEVVTQMKEHFRLSEQIIRNLVVHFDERTLRLEEEQQRRNKVLEEARTVSSYQGDRPARPAESSERPDERRKPEPEAEAEATPEPKAEEAEPTETEEESPVEVET